MWQKVEAYRTSDGKLFDSKEEAARYDISCMLNKSGENPSINMTGKMKVDFIRILLSICDKDELDNVVRQNKPIRDACKRYENSDDDFNLSDLK